MLCPQEKCIDISTEIVFEVFNIRYRGDYIKRSYVNAHVLITPIAAKYG